jgi:hypothetical protein
MHLQKQKKADLKKVKKSGWLSVQALPWGFVKTSRSPCKAKNGTFTSAFFS